MVDYRKTTGAERHIVLKGEVKRKERQFAEIGPFVRMQVQFSEGKKRSRDTP